jgi:hypothetical protein
MQRVVVLLLTKRWISVRISSSESPNCGLSQDIRGGLEASSQLRGEGWAFIAIRE